MGYTTDFTGSVTVKPPLNEYEISYLNKFSETRRMRRAKGPYFVEGTGFAGQGRDGDIQDYNSSDASQPGLWCKWVPTDDGSGVEWDGGEKFYDSVRWMQYLIDHFLKPGCVVQELMRDWPADWPLPAEFGGFTFDHVANGRIEAEGEADDDVWTLVVADNVVSKVIAPTLTEKVEADQELRAALDRVKDAGVTVRQYADWIGEDY